MELFGHLRGAGDREFDASAMVKHNAMRFNEINRIILFGGSRLLVELAREVRQLGEYSLLIYTCDRQLEDVLTADGMTLLQYLKEDNFSYVSTDDINSESTIRSNVTPNTLGLGLGEAWTFNPDLIDLFAGRLLDIMGIPLPRYRGGAHYTWLLLNQEKRWGCNLQLINEEMVQGVFDSGEIVKSREYTFPETVRTPMDCFDFAVAQETDFIKEFLTEVKNGRNFELKVLDERKSVYFPRLNTQKHGLINWQWCAEDLDRFICAFDVPYVGASTFINGRKVHLKQCRMTVEDGQFHPFQAGLIYRITGEGVFVAATTGTIIVGQIVDETGVSVIEQCQTGDRFFTPSNELSAAMLFNAEYTT